MAYGRRRCRCVFLCTYRESEEVVVGNDLGGCRRFLLGPPAMDRQPDPASKFSRLLRGHRHWRVCQNLAFRLHVGRRQCQLRPHHALSGHVAGHRRGHWRHAGRRHVGPAPHAWTARLPLHQPQRALHDVGHRAGAGGDRHRLVGRTPEGTAAGQARRGIQSHQGAPARRHVRHFLVGNVLSPSTPQSRSPQRLSMSASSRSMPRCPATSSSWAAERW